ncbi:GumC family protein [Sinorhizobium sp. BG8]|uniref:GumC family protein n=1 Tax=Sinorhizobium sp. BG8 TaxID=2613773 RepID=UPI001AF364FD|nr:GumC family protein [Sinorhizobium sp. BG8]QRM53736.1 hypothetical protein F3Y30_03555 [Sinorhizobium sp. BG8]
MDIDIFQLPGILRRRIRYVVLTALACVLLGLAFLLLQKPYYRSTAELLVDVGTGPVVGSETGMGAEGASGGQQTLGSQLYILQSRQLLHEVVKELSLTSDPYFAGTGGWRQKLFGGVTKASEEGRADGVVSALQQDLIVERQGETLVFTVSAKHRDSEMAARIANAVANAYLRQTDASRSDANLRTSMALQVQAEELRKRLLDAQAAVEKFRAENGLISTGAQGLVSDQQLSGLNQQLLAASQLVEQQRTIAEQAKQLNVLDVESGAIPEALQSASLSTLRSRYAQMLDRQAELSANLGDGHPQMRAARSQTASMKIVVEKELGRIRQSTENNYERAKSNLAALQKRFDGLTETNSDSGKARIRLTQLQSEATAIDAVYKSFLTRAEELSRQQDIGKGNSRIISQAVPAASPVQAPKLLVLIAALLFGTAAGSALAVLREVLAGTLRSERNLLAATGVPVLAILEAEHSVPSGWSARVSEALSRLKVLSASGAAIPGRAPAFGLARAAHMLRIELAKTVPATIIVLSAGTKGGSHAVAAGIARELSLLGEEVLFFNGELRAEKVRSLGAVRSVKVSTGLGRPATDMDSPAHALQDLLEFEWMGDRGRRVVALSSVRVGTRPLARKSSFNVVDACQTPAGEMLPILLDHVDGILIVSEIGATSTAALSALVEEIGPWREKLLGNVVVSQQAVWR